MNTGIEAWEYGNTVIGDGCSADWSTIEASFMWSDSVWTIWTRGKTQDLTKTSSIIQYGDGLSASSEICDDGNTSSGDGCSSNGLTIE